MRSGDFVAITRYPRRGRPRAGDVKVTRYGKVVKARGEQITVEIDGVRELVCRKHVQPLALPAGVAQAMEAVFNVEAA